jgi:cytochrome o ubiquinol oxidase operon protein cyoD
MLKSYATGFVLAVILTVIPFGLVATHALEPAATLAAIAVLALVQVAVHLRFFLHLDLRTAPRENLLALGFAALVILIMIGGSLWIMLDLHTRMMPG